MGVYQLSCLRSYSPHQSDSRSCGQTTDLLQSLMELPIGGEYDLGALRRHSPTPPNEPLPSSSPGRYPKNWQLLQVSFLSVILIPPRWPVMYIVTDVILSVLIPVFSACREDYHIILRPCSQCFSRSIRAVSRVVAVSALCNMASACLR